MKIEGTNDSQDDFIKWIDRMDIELRRAEYMAEFFLQGLKNDIRERLIEDKNIRHIDYMFSAIDEIDIKSDSDPDFDFYELLGVQAFDNGNYIVAEEAFRRLEGCGCFFDSKWRLAHLIRRGQVRDIEKYHAEDVTDLLMDGVKNKKVFYIVELALFMSLNYGDVNSWDLADQLISFLDNKSPKFAEIIDLWQKYRGEGELEGLLLFLWLIRHGHIQAEEAEYQELVKRIQDKLPLIPEKILKIRTSYEERQEQERRNLSILI